MRRLLWVFAALMLVQFGCEDRDTRELVAPAPPSEGGDDLPDGDKMGDGLATEFHGSTSRYAQERIALVTARSDVRRLVERFETLGYELARDQSFVASGTRSSDGRNVDVTILSMRNTHDQERDAIYVFCLRDDGRELVVPARLSFGEGGLGYTRLADGVWLGAVRPTVDDREGMATSSAVFSWRQYFECIGSAISGALIACTLTCRIFPHVYVQCVTICMGQAALAAIIGCVFFQVG